MLQNQRFEQGKEGPTVAIDRSESCRERRRKGGILQGRLLEEHLLSPDLFHQRWTV